jgi:hypothetical protein
MERLKICNADKLEFLKAIARGKTNPNTTSAITNQKIVTFKNQLYE